MLGYPWIEVKNQNAYVKIISVANAYCIVHWMVREGKDDDIFLLIQKL